MDKVRELSAKKENIELRIRELSLEHEQARCIYVYVCCC